MHLRRPAGFAGSTHRAGLCARARHDTGEGGSQHFGGAPGFCFVKNPRGYSQGAAIALAIALTAGLALAWSPRYWSVGAAVVSLTLAALFWAVTAGTVRLPLQMIPVALLGSWGLVQLLL